jgi:hypothetical protein
MQRRLALWMSVVSTAAALSSACGSSSSLASNLAPSGAVTLASLTITLNTPSVGAGTQATATATFSNGSTSAVASGFTSDTPSVATVTASGAVTGVSIGDATISVDYQGMRASKKIHVLPSYSGTFAGTYTVSDCTETGGFVNSDPTQDFCTGVIGLVGGIAIQSTQSADLTLLTGLFQLGNVVGSGSGTVSSSGTLSYAGGVVIPSSTTRLDFLNWVASSPTPGHITGSFEVVFTDTTITGQGVLICSNLDMTRQASAASMPLSTLISPTNADWRSLILGQVRHR